MMKRIGKYNVLKVKAVTPFSKIYKCHDPDLGEDVAVKVFDISPEECDPEKRYGAEEWRGRFLRGAKVQAAFDHPHIIAVNEISSLEDGTPYFVMPYMSANLVHEIGEDTIDPEAIKKLPKRLHPRSVEPGRAVSILCQLLEALDALHQRRVVHRDVKPGNILLERPGGEHMKLCDFGMVKTPKWKHSRSGVWIGTYDYLSPEQLKSAKTVDSRADVFSVGVLAYRMLTGKIPMGAFQTPHEIKPEIPLPLSQLVMAAMAPEKGRRPRNAGKLLARLTRIKETVPLTKQDASRRRKEQTVKALGLYRKIFPEMRSLGVIKWNGLGVLRLVYNCIMAFGAAQTPANIPQGPNSDMAQAYYILGNVLMKRGDQATAAICYKRAAGLAPNHAEARRAMLELGA